MNGAFAAERVTRQYGDAPETQQSDGEWTDTLLFDELKLARNRHELMGLTKNSLRGSELLKLAWVS